MTEDETNFIPLEASAPERAFDIVLRGYDRSQVDRQIAYLESLVARAESQAAAAAAENERLRGEISGEKPSWESLGRRVTSILQLAEEEAADIKAGAELSARELEARVARLQDESERAHADRLQASEQEVAHLTRGAHAEAQRLVSDAHAQADQITREAHEELAALAAQRDAIRSELEQLHERLMAAMAGAAAVAGVQSGQPLGAQLPHDPEPAQPVGSSARAGGPGAGEVTTDTIDLPGAGTAQDSDVTTIHPVRPA